uniref:Uncharacterized protein n=1 Tax=Rhizophora mucronata TaxID=61149 RepID=A0A2P2P3Y8_RHIMU
MNSFTHIGQSSFSVDVLLALVSHVSSSAATHSPHTMLDSCREHG